MRPGNIRFATARSLSAEIVADEQRAPTAGGLVHATAWSREHGVTIERVLTDNGGTYRSLLRRLQPLTLARAPFISSSRAVRNLGVSYR